MKEQKKRPSATTIRLDPQDREAIAHLKEVYGCPSDVAAIKLALRMIARQEPRLPSHQTRTQLSSRPLKGDEPPASGR